MLPTPDVETVTSLIENGLSHLDQEVAGQVVASVGNMAASTAVPVAGPLLGVMIAGLTQEKTNEWLAATDQQIDDLLEDLDEDERTQAMFAKTLRGLTSVLPDGDRWANTCLQTAAGDPDQLLALLDTYQNDPDRRATFETAVEELLAGEFNTGDDDLLSALQTTFQTDTEEEALQIFLDVQDLLQAREVHDTLETVYEIEAQTETVRTEITAFRGSVEDQLDDLFRAELRNQGFERLTELSFRNAWLDDPVTCWRLGFGLPEINEGYALPREYPTDDGQRQRMSADLQTRLEDGEDTVVLGYAGSGKSTLVRQVAVQWYLHGRGTVLHYRADRAGTFDDPGYLYEHIDDGEGHVLVVIEDAAGPPAEATYDLLNQYADAADVSMLLDSRQRVWETEGAELADPRAKELRRTALTEYPVRPLDEREVERAIAWLEEITHAAVEIPYEPTRLYNRIRTETAGEIYHLGYRLAAYLADPLEADEALEASGFAADATQTYNLLVDEVADDLALPVGMLLNILNAAEGLTPHRALVHALALPDGDHARVDELLNQLDGRVFFGTDDAGRYRTQHPAWSLRFLEEGLTRDDRARREAKTAFERAVNTLFALVDDEGRRTAIRRALRAAPPIFEEIDDDPEAAAGRYIRAVFSIGEQRPGLAPLFGRSKYADINLPSVVSDEYERWIQTQRGHFWLDAGFYEAAEEEYTAVKDRGDRALETRSLNKLGAVAQAQGEYKQAREYREKSLELARDLGDRALETRSLNDLGAVARVQGEYEQARKYLRESLELARDIGDQTSEANCLNKLGVVAQAQGEFERAREHYKRSLELVRDLGDRALEAWILNDLGAVARGQGEYEQAREYFEKSVEISLDIGAIAAGFTTLGNLVDACEQRDAIEEAIDWCDRGIELAEERGNNDVCDRFERRRKELRSR